MKRIVPLFIVTAIGVISSLAQGVLWQQPTATYSQPNYDVAAAVDSNPATGWGVAQLDSATRAETAVFETVQDLQTGPDILLTFHLVSGGFPGANLGRYRLSVTGDDRIEFADGHGNGGDVTADWEVLEPLSFHTVGGATLTKLDDNSLLASGANPNFDTNVVVARSSLPRITGVRIEMMLDDSLPTSGPGRHANGNFVLYEIGLTSERAEPPTNVVVFDLQESFSRTNNPNPPWVYGWAGTVGGAFTALTSASSTTADGGVTLPFWQLAGVTLPSVYKNVSSQPLSVGNGSASFPAGTVWFFAGVEGREENYGVIRFTVPTGAAGHYALQTEVSPVYPNSSQGDTDFHVVRNGQELFGQFLAPTNTASYSNMVALEEGGTIDFVVGRGADNHVSGSGLRIAATLTQVTNAPPEPPQPTNQIIVNGSFELGSTPGISLLFYAPDATTITGWTLESGSIDYIGTRWVAQDGHRCLDMTGTSPGTVSQMLLGLEVGHWYELSFALAGNPEMLGALPVVKRLEARVGTNSQEYAFDATGATVDDLHWTTKTLNFQATDSSMKLSFVSLTPGLGGAALDQVVVVPIEAPPQPPQGTTYVLNDSFSASNNPNPPWAYGWAATVGGAFTALTSASSTTADGGVTLPFWQLAGVTLPSVYKNVSSQPLSVGNGSASFPPGTVWFFAGLEGRQENYGIIRFTVPIGAAGQYALLTDVSPVYPNSSQGDTDFHVVRNGQELFSRFLAPTNTASYSNMVALEEGGTIDFVVGRGLDNHVSGSGLRIAASLTQVTNAPPEPPEPPTNLVFNVTESFSRTNNPNPPWVYGWAGTVGGAFTALTSASSTTADGGATLPFWQLAGVTLPSVYKNESSQPLSVGNGSASFPPGTVWFFAGVEGRQENYGVIRFTVPSGAAGQYALQTEVSPVYPNSSQGDTDFHVVRNGQELFGQFLAPTNTASYSNMVALEEGGTIDFVVGRGVDNHVSGSGLRIAATLTQLTNAPPEPPQPTNGLVINGSFELGSDPGVSLLLDAPDTSTITGWTLENGSIDYIGSRWVAQDGQRCLDLSGTSAGTISQIIQGLEAGHWYRLSFALAGNPEMLGMLPVIKRMQAAVGTVAREYAFDATGGTVNGLHWVTKALDFQATASSTKLSFVSLTPGLGGAALDKVSIEPIDEPPQPPHGTDYVLSDGFSTTDNPNGPWAYGWSRTVGGAFTPLNSVSSTIADGGVRLPFWQLAGVTLPSVYKNVSDQTISVGGGEASYPPGTVWFFAGMEGRIESFGVIRFTLPSGAAGTYELKADVSPVYLSGSQGDTDFHIVSSGRQVFGQFLPPSASAGYSNVVSLEEGATIDFVVGRGIDNHVFGSGLRIAATLTQVTNAPPEPPEPPVGLVFNLQQSFSVTNNPNGPWAYGWEGSVGGSFTALNSVSSTTADGGVTLPFWQLAGVTLPSVYKNVSSQTIGVGNGAASFPPETIWFFAGLEGRQENYGVIRFTVPTGAAGQYTLQTDVSPVYPNSSQGDSDFHVVHDGQEVFSRFLAPSDSASYSNVVALEEGGIVDFVVGRGADNHVSGSGLRIAATLTQVTNVPPEPPEPPQPTNGLVINGSFELGSYPGVSLLLDAPDASTIAGWVLENGSIDYIGSRWVAQDGQRCLDLSGTSAGTISQIIQGLEAGHWYRLSFALAGNPEILGILPAVKRMQAVVGTVSREYAFDATGATVNDLHWVTKTLDFQATTSSTKLSFVSQTPGLGGAALDKVFIEPIDEPPQPPQFPTYVLTDGFSRTDNPNGPWAYGWAGAVGGAFTTLNSASSTIADGGVTLPFWQLAGVTLPSVYKNVSDRTMSVGNGLASYPPGTVWFFAGLEGRPENYGVIRFTLPAGAAGHYELKAEVSPVYISSPQGDTDFHIVHSGHELFSRFLPPSDSASFSNVLALEEGATIDFVVGRGADNHVSGSGLRIAATLYFLTNAPPEPPGNHPPAARNQIVRVRSNSTNIIRLTATDPDGDALTYRISAAEHGTLTGSGPEVTYTPLPDYRGSDEFSFHVNDGHDGETTAIVTITVGVVSNAPVANIVVEPRFEIVPNDDHQMVISINNSNAWVALDGSHSVSDGQQAAQFSWWIGAQLIGDQSTVTNLFDLGLHEVHLVVGSGAATASDGAVFEVVTPSQAAEELVQRLEEAPLSRLQKRPLLAMLRLAIVALEQGDIGAGAKRLDAFKIKVRARILPNTPELAQKLCAMADATIEALNRAAVQSQTER